MPEDWSRALVVLAHPDDAEYGPAAAVAAWTAAGKEVAYVLATRGEAGIAGVEPADAGPLREEEQRRACARVGVDSLEFLDHPDGALVEGLELRRDVAGAIRRHRPELVVTAHWGETWSAPGQAPGYWNSADHRVLGRAVMDAVQDAANQWLHPGLRVDGFDAWAGVRWVAVSAPPDRVTHVVDVGAVLDAAVASLAEHRRYLEALSPDPVEEQARRQVDMVTAASERSGGRRVAGFALYAGPGGP
jgi:LmbE family N-acetylglucosaminyl deacetylase